MSTPQSISAGPPKDDKLKHPCFPQPDAETRVWRYMDLAKFIWLLENRALYFSRIDQLNDPHEGSTPPLLAQARDHQLGKSGDGKSAALMASTNVQLRKSTYVNCWHLGNPESEAMWRLYCPSDGGIALQTTYGKLVRSIDHDAFCYIGRVTYIDFETQVFPFGNAFYAVMHKRASFAHESEVRLVKSNHDFWGVNSPEAPIGFQLSWQPEEVLDAVYVNPYAPDFFKDVVSSVVRRMAPQLADQVRWSQMRAAPTF